MSKGNGETAVVTALARGLSILRCFDRPRLELTVSEISRRVGLNQPTTWRLCQTLLEFGFVVRSANGAALRIGAPALTLGYAAIKGQPFQEIALPYLRRLRAETHFTATLSLREGTDMISMERVDGELVRPDEPIGWRAPLTNVSSGLAVLAQMSEAEREEVLELIPDAEAHRSRVVDACEQYARAGYVRLDGMLRQYTAVGIALVQPTENGRNFWAITCGGISTAWDEETSAKAGKELKEIKSLLEPALAALSG